MARVAHLDIIGGISGDMFLGALLDVGLIIDALDAEVRKVVPEGWRLHPSQARRGAVRGTHVAVDLDDGRRWDWTEFGRAIHESHLPDTDRLRASQVFDVLMAAETEAHDGDASHLHELGTTDTLVDIVGAVVGLRLLGIERLHASPLPMSVGVARSSHGVTASIAPATMAIVRQHGLPLATGRSASMPTGEAVTPTGAALTAVLADPREAALQMRIKDVGYGVGTRDAVDPPNVLGLWLGDSAPASAGYPSTELASAAEALAMDQESDKWLLETNIDDATGEMLGYAMERMFAAGARDVWMTQILMKKGRPGTTLSAIVASERLTDVARAVMSETTTFGMRCTPLQRLVAQRRVVRVVVDGVEVGAKVRLGADGAQLIAPEYDECAELARRRGVPLAEVMRAVEQRVRAQLSQADSG